MRGQIVNELCTRFFLLFYAPNQQLYMFYNFVFFLYIYCVIIPNFKFFLYVVNFPMCVGKLLMNCVHVFLIIFAHWTGSYICFIFSFFLYIYYFWCFYASRHAPWFILLLTIFFMYIFTVLIVGHNVVGLQSVLHVHPLSFTFFFFVVHVEEEYLFFFIIFI